MVDTEPPTLSCYCVRCRMKVDIDATTAISLQNKRGGEMRQGKCPKCGCKCNTFVAKNKSLGVVKKSKKKKKKKDVSAPESPPDETLTPDTDLPIPQEKAPAEPPVHPLPPVTQSE